MRVGLVILSLRTSAQRTHSKVEKSNQYSPPPSLKNGSGGRGSKPRGSTTEADHQMPQTAAAGVILHSSFKLLVGVGTAQMTLE